MIEETCNIEGLAQKTLLKLIVTIIDRNKAEKVLDFYKSERIHSQFVSVGFGTATSEILDVFGLGESDKAVIFCIAPKFKVEIIFEDLKKKLHLDWPGRGIAFTVPISGINSLFYMLNNDIQNKIESELSKMDHPATKNSLIFTAVNQGYTDDLMETAHKAGAKGGTILHARGIGSEEAERFLGITMQSEKEIVLIVVPKEKKREIMKAICTNHGLKTEAQGMVLSLPVEDMVGLNDSE